MRLCSVEGCKGTHEAKGYCGKHYQKYKKYGNPIEVYMFKKHKFSCSVENCFNPYYSLGYCQKHYERNMRYGNPCYTKIEMHGKSKTSEYRTWIGMIQRCCDSNSKMYYRYGGRGITICEEWRNSFEKFYLHMGQKPFSNAQIDRIDNNGNYEPGNCRWTTLKENVRNSSSTKLKPADVRKIKSSDLSTWQKIKNVAIKYGVSIASIYDIINNNTWPDIV